MARQQSISSFNVYAVVKASSIARYRSRVSLLKRSRSRSSQGIQAYPARYKKRIQKVKKVSIVFIFRLLQLRRAYYTLKGSLQIEDRWLIISSLERKGSTKSWAYRRRRCVYMSPPVRPKTQAILARVVGKQSVLTLSLSYN